MRRDLVAASTAPATTRPEGKRRREGEHMIATSGVHATPVLAEDGKQRVHRRRESVAIEFAPRRDDGIRRSRVRSGAISPCDRVWERIEEWTLAQQWNEWDGRTGASESRHIDRPPVIPSS